MPINVFGQGAVQTAYVNYRYVDLSLGSQVLVWPTSYVDTPNTLAASMVVNTNENNTNTLTLPDATMATVGQNFIIFNAGSSAFNLLNASGTIVKNIPSTALSNVYWVQLTDNSVSNGEWLVIQYGAGTSNADAVKLAGVQPGNGITPIGGATLATNIPVQIKNANYNVLNSDRANLIVWTGGEGSIILPAINTIASGFFVSLNNEGDGALTLITIDNSLIDKALLLNVAVGQSLSVISNGNQWWSLGFGQNVFGNYILPIELGGTASTTASDAITSLMPVSANGALAFFNGLTWITLPPGGNNSTLKIVNGIPAWVAP